MMALVWWCSEVAAIVLCGVPVLYSCSQVANGTASPLLCSADAGCLHVALSHSAFYVLLCTCQRSYMMTLQVSTACRMLLPTSSSVMQPAAPDRPLPVRTSEAQPLL